MNVLKPLLSICIIASITLACKNDTKEPVKIEEDVVKTAPEKVKKVKKELTVAEKEQLNSVMSKLMVTDETKNFASALVSSGLTDMLSKNKGPYTVFAPSNTAFDSITNEKRRKILDPKNKETLSNLLKNHIVEGEVDSSTLLQKSKGNSNTFKTLGGSTLTIKKQASDLVIVDANGAKAVLGKSDINGSNGLVHVIDKVLSLN
ncbi:fasciclin domain-containing protein [Marixanthomonas ophiurae]|uniref:Fasciclin domain-containing protein n=1 Tax=Marixanthomonas ophiurae TaxID=387659 RepID=A0A3E1QCL1_9FLAO|nr:fasciclin domain-containing protein [Marixanthomonas ophiurae]RFN59885.1 fasciclin domain-containing protein [Marixanthomonas ophiurae]